MIAEQPRSAEPGFELSPALVLTMVVERVAGSDAHATLAKGRGCCLHRLYTNMAVVQHQQLARDRAEHDRVIYTNDVRGRCFRSSKFLPCRLLFGFWSQGFHST